jgi:putative oxidoreductase
MNMTQRIEHWSEAHPSKLLDIVRVFLGILIFAKGVSFVSDTETLGRIIDESQLQGMQVFSIILAHYIACAHLVGGILIMLGLITRVAIGFQIPILIGAVFFVNITKGFSTLNSELWLSILVLLLLIFFFVYGSGKWSVDEWMKTHKEQ